MKKDFNTSTVEGAAGWEAAYNHTPDYDPDAPTLGDLDDTWESDENEDFDEDFDDYDEE